jgi:hypothetical protein
MKTEEVFDTGRFPMEFAGEVFEFTVWANGLGEIKARNTDTDEIVYEQRCSWSTPSFARQWAMGAMILRYGY